MAIIISIFAYSFRQQIKSFFFFLDLQAILLLILYKFIMLRSQHGLYNVDSLAFTESSVMALAMFNFCE